MRLIIIISLVLSIFLLSTSDIQAASKEKEITAELKDEGA